MSHLLRSGICWSAAEKWMRSQGKCATLWTLVNNRQRQSDSDKIMCMCVSIYLSIYVCVCVCVCMYVDRGYMKGYDMQCFQRTSNHTFLNRVLFRLSTYHKEHTARTEKEKKDTHSLVNETMCKGKLCISMSAIKQKHI